MPESWFFPPIEPYRVQGRGLAEDNFAQETRTGLEILMREALQNPLDARSEHKAGAVRVSVRLLSPGQFDRKYLESLIDKDYLSRLGASRGEAAGLDFSSATVLVLEDFGTTGLLGTYTDSTVDGNGENWNAFWFREGEGAKAGIGSNGRAGQGKVTYYRVGAARAVFGLTVRESDGKCLLMGRSSFRRNYIYNGVKCERDAFWCQLKGKNILPADEAEGIEMFRKAFGLQRKSEPGLSLVVPFAMEFDEQGAVQTVLSEFYFPIASGRLEVTIGKTEITAANVDVVADEVLPDALVRERNSCLTRGFRGFCQSVIAAEKTGIKPIELNAGWEKSSMLTEAAFPEGELERLRSALEKDERISVRCPIRVKPKKSTAIPTWFDVHLQVPEELERVEEAYIRRDLLIGAEVHLAGSTYLPKARGLTLIEHPQMSAFLADAEEPTHLKWNASRPRLSEDYQSPRDVVRAVRNALPRLLAFLSGRIVKRDVKALAKYFAKPADEGTKHAPSNKRVPGTITKIKPDDIPKPKPKPFRLDTGADWISVLPNGRATPVVEDLPISCVLEIAYEGLDQDPFREYDPFDFDLADGKTHAAAFKGISVTNRQGNRVEFEVLDPAFALTVSGFDRNIRLRARLTYKEKENGATVSAE